MSQMPSKIWLHKDTKYSTGDMVCGYQYDFVQGIEDEGGIENFVEYVPADVFIEKAVNFFEEYLVEEDCKFGHAEWKELKSKFESIDDFIRAFKYHINEK